MSHFEEKEKQNASLFSLKNILKSWNKILDKRIRAMITLCYKLLKEVKAHENRHREKKT